MHLQLRRQSWTERCCKQHCDSSCSFTERNGIRPTVANKTLKQLMRHGTGISNIEITDANIKAFSQTAKKYGIDFALKKTDDRYLVFFKGRDADVLTAAFREFSAKKLDMERKPSVRRDIGEKKAEAAKRTAARDTVKKMDRGIDR